MLIITLVRSRLRSLPAARRTCFVLATFLAFLLGPSYHASAFPVTTARGAFFLSRCQKYHSHAPFRGWNSRRQHGSIALAAAPPILDDWRITRSGEVIGTVRNHPTLEDGDIITTSRLENSEASSEGAVVVTESGSKYKLGPQKGGKRAKAAPVKAKAAPVSPPPKANSAPASPPRKSKVVATPPKPSSAKRSVPTATKSAKDSKDELAAQLREAKIKYGLNGKTVANGKYLLAGKPQRSTSGKSQIWTAYRSAPAGEDSSVLLPTGGELTIKISPNIDAVTREDGNYRKVASGLIRGQFMNRLEFLLDAGKGFENQCALVLENGHKDLKALLKERKMRGLEGREMRDAAAAAAQCIQAMHASSMVWTDLKSENFVVVDDPKTINDGSLPVRGIDLESAMPMGGNPVDYSPEACPPEFAKEYLQGEGADFVLESSYDIWSFGMMLYELNTGKAYFGTKSPLQITKVLTNPQFEANADAVKDDKLRDLILQCLRPNPKKRPSITQLLLHPYFLTSGIGPYSF